MEDRHSMKLKVAKYMAEFFVRNNVTDMFMVTGGAAMHLNDAFGHQEGLQILLIRGFWRLW